MLFNFTSPYHVRRLHIIYVDMRRNDTGVERCHDALHIHDFSNDTFGANKDHEYHFCGDISNFHLMLSNRVLLEVSIGKLLAKMPDMIGFGIVFEAISKFRFFFFYLSTYQHIF